MSAARIIIKCMMTDHYLNTVQRIASEACTNGWELVSVSAAKLGSTSFTEYLITIKAIVEDGQKEPPLPQDWKER